MRQSGFPARRPRPNAHCHRQRMPTQRRMMSPVSTIISRRKSSQIDRVGFSVLPRLCRRFAISAVARGNDYAASKDGKMEGHERKYYPQGRIARLSPSSKPLRNPRKTAGRISLRAPLRYTTPHCAGTGHGHQTVTIFQKPSFFGAGIFYLLQDTGTVRLVVGMGERGGR